MSGRVIRVDSWEEFKQLIKRYGAKEIAYRVEMGVPARHLTGLRFILPTPDAQYVFVDTAMEDRLRRTGIKLRADKLGNIYVSDEDIISFIKSELGDEKIKLYSYFTI